MGNKKGIILAVAEELITVNGIAETTIAQIARGAGVADSLVYQHFKNKEDLLFSVAAKKLQEALDLLDEQLQGIRDPESRLRKLIWYGLKYNDLNPGYARILLFECRSNKEFYQTEAYQLIRKHAGITVDILRQGIADGVFRSDINVNVVRDLIYGTLDFEAISCLSTGEIKQSHPDLEDIMDLVMPMIQAKSAEPITDKRKRILEAAESLFAKNGFNKSTMVEIAEKAKVAEGTIYEYFKTKDDLLLSIHEIRLAEHLESVTEAFDVRSPFRKLRRLIRYHFALYMINRDFLKIFLLHGQLNPRFYQSKAYATYQKYLQIIDEVLREGQKAGIFREKINGRVFRNIFLGAFSHMALRWMIADQAEPSDKMMETDELINLLMDAVSHTE